MAEREPRPFYIRRSLVRTGLLTGILGGIAFVGGGAWDPTSMLYSIGLLFLATSATTLVGTVVSWFLPGARQEAEMVEKLEQLAEAEEKAAIEAEAEAAVEASMPALAELPRPAWSPPHTTTIYESGSLGYSAPESTVYVSRSASSAVEPTVYTPRFQEPAQAPPPPPPPAPVAAPPARRSVKTEMEMLERMGAAGPGDQEGLMRALRQFGND